MFDPDALVRRATRTADDGRSFAVQPTVSDDDAQAPKCFTDDREPAIWLISG